MRYFHKPPIGSGMDDPNFYWSRVNLRISSKKGYGNKCFRALINNDDSERHEDQASFNLINISVREVRIQLC